MGHTFMVYDLRYFYDSDESRARSITISVFESHIFRTGIVNVKKIDEKAYLYENDVATKRRNRNDFSFRCTE